MRVAYDGSVLGAGYINPKSKTGVFRVAESLLLELSTQSRVELAIVALNRQSNILDEISIRKIIQENYSDLECLLEKLYSSHCHFELIYQALIKVQAKLLRETVQRRILFYRLVLAVRILMNRFVDWDNKLQFDPDLFDIYHSIYYALPAQEVTRDLPRILTIHDLIPVLHHEWMTPRKRQQFVAILNSIDRDRDWIICNSQCTKHDFCTYTKMNPERVFVTPLAVARFLHPITDGQIIAATLQQYGIPNTPYLLSLATLEPRKNLAFLIRCFAHLIQENPDLDLNLVLVGVSGWKNAEVFRAVNQNPQVRSRIFFTGYLPDQDLSAIYSGAIAFVYPSLYEGFGLPPLEAMQCGTPVITSNTSSLPEVVGDAGILVDPTQADDLSHALLQLATNSSLRFALAERAIDRARQFSWASCAKQTVDVYRIAAANRTF